MPRSLALIILLLSAGILVFSLPAYASNHTFSVYGVVLDDDGTPIPGTTIRLVEPVNGTFSQQDPGILSTVTDAEGKFQFVNVTAGSDTCGITIWYPDHKQYFPPGNSFRPFEASGIQYVNVTRIRVESDAPPPVVQGVTPASMSSVFAAIFLAGLICFLRDRLHR